MRWRGGWRVLVKGLRHTKGLEMCMNFIRGEYYEYCTGVGEVTLTQEEFTVLFCL